MKALVSFVGPHNAGKTTLIVEVARVLREKGHTIAVLKHGSHGFDLTPGKDAEMLFESGIDHVYAVSPGASLVYERHREEPDVNAIVSWLGSKADLVIVEGYKKQPFPKIEVTRAEIARELLDIQNRIAIVCDFPVEVPVPVFDFQAVQEIADFIISYFGLNDFLKDN